MLRYAHFVTLGQALELGEQTHINHKGCDAGVDTKRRLYIKRGNEDGHDIILAHCHHCGESGYYREDVTRPSKRSRTTISTGSSGHVTLPRDFTKDWNSWPKQARVWIGISGVSEGDASRWGIGYSKEYNRIVLPYHRDGTLMGYQLRALDTEDKPKYLTFTNEKPLYWYSGKHHDTLVIVEDMLSAIRCSKFADAVAILGSDMNERLYALISAQAYTNFIIFLDNDNRQVKLNQIKIKRKLDILAPTRIIRENKDPKEFDDRTLEDLLYGDT